MKRVTTILCLAAALSTSAFAATQTINLQMKEMSFTPMNISLKAGQPVQFNISNTGKAVHEFQAYVTPKTAPKDEAGWDAYMTKNTLWLGSKDVKLTVDGKVVKGPFIEVQLNSGQKGVLTFTPSKAGNFDIACHKPGHYESGMKGKLQVK